MSARACPLSQTHWIARGDAAEERFVDIEHVAAAAAGSSSSHPAASLGALLSAGGTMVEERIKVERRLWHGRFVPERGRHRVLKESLPRIWGPEAKAKVGLLWFKNDGAG